MSEFWTRVAYGAVGMSEPKNEEKNVNTDGRDLIVAYLSYALDDVRALSVTGSHLLELTIATISEEAAVGNSSPASPVASSH